MSLLVLILLVCLVVAVATWRNWWLRTERNYTPRHRRRKEDPNLTTCGKV